MKYFVMYIVFNDGRKFVLSNIYNILLSYYSDGLAQEDYHCKPDLVVPGGYYFSDEVGCSSKRFKEMLEQRFGVYRTYYIERICGDCRFVFGAVNDHKIERPAQYYKGSIAQFENFSYQFALGAKAIILKHNPQYASSFIFNNDNYLKSVVHNQPLTSREVECLYWAAHGKSSEETSLILGVSLETVKSHRKRALKKLNVVNVTQAVFEAAKRGLFSTVGESEALLN